MHNFLYAFGSGIAFGLGVLAGLTIAMLVIKLTTTKDRKETLEHFKRVEERLQKQSDALVIIAECAQAKKEKTL
jgi:uncharacterized membrane-anchored protein YhcB (DUF1043 family)